MEYVKNDVLRLAKRLNNPKRAYLLVNPLQGKHVPVHPAAALDMMRALGEKLYRRFPEARLVIGFAETATAVGAAAAACFPDDCVYIHTTREKLSPDTMWICFQEEHSHAVDQKLCADDLRAWIRDTPQVILVDDELSTGKTVLNMVRQMRRMIPEMKDKPVVAASIINRISDVDEAKLLREGIACEYLVHITNEDYTAQVLDFQTESPDDRRNARVLSENLRVETLDLRNVNSRKGVVMGKYLRNCMETVDGILPIVRKTLGKNMRVLVLGTEEFMFLPLRLAFEIERHGLVEEVFFHATTRSPIEICRNMDYPLFNGYRIASFYETGRDTYVYDLAEYDAVIVLTDSNGYPQAAVDSLMSALREYNCKNIMIFTGGGYV